MGGTDTSWSVMRCHTLFLYVSHKNCVHVQTFLQPGLQPPAHDSQIFVKARSTVIYSQGRESQKTFV
ncbi:hypothetical protein OUZ56_009628 [Daphnia magna]|uniref:Uncharacterized protein n=1 Tax=Daphnia magna TaxID=35525 RepID=A0ABR0AGI8_9CRUS|nr:hypothetical protein OUZ56_009628 [Daphnia magna]